MYNTIRNAYICYFLIHAPLPGMKTAPRQNCEQKGLYALATVKTLLLASLLVSNLRKIDSNVRVKQAMHTTSFASFL